MPSLVSNINSKHVTSLTPIYLIKTLGTYLNVSTAVMNWLKMQIYAQLH